MPPPIKVTLLPHRPEWADEAVMLGAKLRSILGSILLDCHHIGSTAIPGIHAKPIVDLIPVVTDLALLDEKTSPMEEAGFDAFGEFGLPGRRYFKLDDPVTGARLAQLHAYQAGSAEITRHLAFRDYLRANSDEAASYDRIKLECQARYPDDSHAYGDCKGGWVAQAERRAVDWYQQR